MTFREKLVRLRKLKDLTQDEFASAVGVSRQAVYKWESGQSYPEVPKLLEIKMLFGISIDDLLDETYEVALPEKKRRKRIGKADKERIEKEVLAEESALVNNEDNAEVAVALDVEAKQDDEVLIEQEPTKEEVAPLEDAVSDIEPAHDTDNEKPKNEEPAQIDYEEPATLTYTSVPVIDSETTKTEADKNQKKGFFARLFNKK